jgi:hypothetical protein
MSRAVTLVRGVSDAGLACHPIYGEKTQSRRVFGICRLYILSGSPTKEPLWGPSFGRECWLCAAPSGIFGRVRGALGVTNHLRYHREAIAN